MTELSNPSAAQPGTKEFWDMIEQIRQEKLPLKSFDPLSGSSEGGNRP